MSDQRIPFTYLEKLFLNWAMGEEVVKFKVPGKQGVVGQGRRKPSPRLNGIRVWVLYVREAPWWQ